MKFPFICYLDMAEDGKMYSQKYGWMEGLAKRRMVLQDGHFEVLMGNCHYKKLIPYHKIYLIMPCCTYQAFS